MRASIISQLFNYIKVKKDGITTIKIILVKLLKIILLFSKKWYNHNYKIVKEILIKKKEEWKQIILDA